MYFVDDLRTMRLYETLADFYVSASLDRDTSSVITLKTIDPSEDDAAEAELNLPRPDRPLQARS
jgi:hypothetical protein